jgi:sirohydrochlorin ferrochelatase
MPTFLFASDLKPQGAPWCAAQSQLDRVGEAAARVLGFDPQVRLVSMPGFPGEADAPESLTHAVDEVCAAGKAEIFVLPASLDFSLWQREALGQVLAEARRRHPAAEIYHDDVDLAHPLLVDAFAAQAASTLAAVGSSPQRAGLLLVSSGHGDPASRAQSYRLMRLLWEQLGLAQGEVGFVKNAQPFLLHSLSRCVSGEPRALSWVVLPQAQWETEHVEYARVILENFRRAGPDTAEFSFADPPGAHPLLTAFYAQRITRLWQEKSQRAGLRVPSAKSAQPVAAPALAKRGSWCVARASDHGALAEALRTILPSEAPERFLVKVTWHGYATGTYTDPAALDLLLGALPAPAIILEGHTSSRNLGGVEFE